MESGQPPDFVFSERQYAIGSEPYLNVFRYFAKLMCCHLADVGAPRPLPIANFAMGTTNENPISLAVSRDWTYKTAASEIGSHQYAAHGGLIVYADKKTDDPKGFHSTLTVGPVQYVFYVRLNWLGRMELRWLHPTFNDWCRKQARRAMAEPLTPVDQVRLGLSADDSI